MVRSHMLITHFGMSVEQQQRRRYTEAANVGIEAIPSSFDVSPVGDANYRAAFQQRMADRRREIFEADGSCGACGGFNGGAGCEECGGTGRRV